MRLRLRTILPAVVLALVAVAGFAPPAVASHNFDTTTQSSCGVAGGSGTFMTRANIDYSSSKASSRLDKLYLRNDTNRTVTARIRHGHGPADDFGFGYDQTFTFTPSTSLTLEINHNAWIGKNEYPQIRVDASASGGALRQYVYLSWYPSDSCNTWTTG